MFFVDQQRSAMKYEVMDQPGGAIASRTLEDGKTFNVVKHFYVPEEITRSLRKNGIETRVSNTPHHFYYAHGEKLPRSVKADLVKEQLKLVHPKSHGQIAQNQP